MNFRMIPGKHLVKRCDGYNYGYDHCSIWYHSKTQWQFEKRLLSA